MNRPKCRFAGDCGLVKAASHITGERDRTTDGGELARQRHDKNAEFTQGEPARKPEAAS